MPNDPHILTAAISALVGVPVITYEEQLRNPRANYQELELDAFHKSVLVAPTPGCPQPGPYPVPQPGQETELPGQSSEPWQPTQTQTHPGHLTWAQWLFERPINVFVRTLDGKSVAITVKLNDSVETLKARIAYKVDLPPEDQRLVFAGKQLENGLILRDYGIQVDSTIHLALRLPGGGGPPPGVYLSKNFLDPRWDHDFTHKNDHGKHFSRGGEEYHRPIGWLRYALKVDGKYGNDTWLGESDASGVWPVSYHGTGTLAAKSIAQTGYDLAKSVRERYGPGIYSAPLVKTAEHFAKYYTVQGKKYKVILQNRVDPDPNNLQKVKPQGKDAHLGPYWISVKDDHIRPYGICIKHE